MASQNSVSGDTLFLFFVSKTDDSTGCYLGNENVASKFYLLRWWLLCHTCVYSKS